MGLREARRDPLGNFTPETMKRFAPGVSDPVRTSGEI